MQHVQAVFPQVFVGKSYARTLSNVGEDNPPMSRLKRETRTAFHLRTTAHQLVTPLHEPKARGNMLTVDVRRYRFNGLAHNVQLSPELLPMDEITPAVAGDFTEFNGVHDPKAKHPTRCAPYV